jgi:peptidyl-prolyl cis-trans isomerase A (cyclophilin A)
MLRRGPRPILAPLLALAVAGCAAQDAAAPRAAEVQVAAPAPVPGPDEQAVTARGERALAARRYAEARRIADECLAARADACACLTLRARIALSTGPAKDEMARATEALEQCPKHARAAAIHVMALAKSGRLEAAEAEVQLRLEANRADPDLLLALAEVQDRMGRTAEALATARRAAAGGGRDAKLLLASIAIAAGELDEAERVLGEIVAANAEDADAHYDLGLAAQKRGDAARALAAYEAALRIDPAFPEALKNSAILCNTAGRREEAREFARRYAEAAPDAADAERFRRLANPPLRPIHPHTGTVIPSPDDPLQGRFTLADATRGLPPGKTLIARIETSAGALECTLFDDKAPITVANFVGLARGTRPWKTPEGRWQKKPAYDGSVFHRIIQAFMIQGGDPRKNGTGEAGYYIPDEIWDGGRHDRAGLLCSANRGPDTNSVQFFITDDAAPHLDGGHTIFGECGPVDVIHRIAGVPVTNDRPVKPPAITKVTVTRR